MKKQEVFEQIKAYLEGHQNEFNVIIEEIDDENGILEGERRQMMYNLNEWVGDITPLQMAEQIGYDDDTIYYLEGYTEAVKSGITKDELNKRYVQHGSFDVNRNYFYNPGFQYLVSTDKKDYTEFLNDDIVADFLSGPSAYTVSSEELNALIVAYEEAEE